jgi:Ca2+-binding EF-hand superfamily protein
VLRELGFNPTYGEIQEYLTAYDRHGDGTKVNFSSLCDIIKTYMQDNPASMFERQMINAFRVFDDESEGYVGTHVIDRALHQLPCITKMTEIRELMSELDREGEGYISYEYFVSSLCTNFAKGLAMAPAPQPLKFSKMEVRDTLDGMIEGPRDDGADPEAAGAVIERRERVLAAWEQQEAERKANGGKKLGKKKGRKALAAAAAAAAAEAAAAVTAAAAAEAAASVAAKVAAAKAAEAKARAEEDDSGVEMQRLFNTSSRGSFLGGGRSGMLDASTFDSKRYEFDASEGSTEGPPQGSPAAAAARQRVATVQEEDDDELDGLVT